MTKKIKIFTGLILLLVSLLTIAACAKDSVYVVSFDTNGGNTIESLEFKKMRKLIYLNQQKKNIFLMVGMKQVLLLQKDLKINFQLQRICNYMLNGILNFK